MSKWIGTALVIASMCTVIGCNGTGTDEQTGGPGADVRSDQDQEPQEPEKTFTASLDEESLELPTGQQKELTVSLERGEGFDQKVVVQVNPPEGISADPEELELASGQQEGKIMLTATSDAPVGDELAVEIEFKPESGESVRKQLTVTVTEAEGGNEQ